MLKYVNTAVTFAEVPDEISLCISVSNCGHRCLNCHSPELQEDIGIDLEQDLRSLLDRFRGRITCVCFLGQGQDPQALDRCCELCKSYGFKVAIYTGADTAQHLPLSKIDYYKIGHYEPKLGGLDSELTNQRMFKRHDNGEVEDITYKFRHPKRMSLSNSE